MGSFPPPENTSWTTVSTIAVDPSLIKKKSRFITRPPVKPQKAWHAQMVKMLVSSQGVTSFELVLQCGPHLKIEKKEASCYATRDKTQHVKKRRSTTISYTTT